jgi:hypothetical protein
LVKMQVEFVVIIISIFLIIDKIKKSEIERVLKGLYFSYSLRKEYLDDKDNSFINCLILFLKN